MSASAWYLQGNYLTRKNLKNYIGFILPWVRYVQVINKKSFTQCLTIMLMRMDLDFYIVVYLCSYYTTFRRRVKTVFFLQDGYSDTLFELMRVRIFYIDNIAFEEIVCRLLPLWGSVEFHGHPDRVDLNRSAGPFPVCVSTL